VREKISQHSKTSACGPRDTMGCTSDVCPLASALATRTMGSMLLPAGCFTKENKREQRARAG
jgi:hypothetical protein